MQEKTLPFDETRTIYSKDGSSIASPNMNARRQIDRPKPTVTSAFGATKDQEPSGASTQINAMDKLQEFRDKRKQRPTQNRNKKSHYSKRKTKDIWELQAERIEERQRKKRWWVRDASANFPQCNVRQNLDDTESFYEISVYNGKA